MTRRLIFSFVLFAMVLLAVLEIPLGVTYARRAQEDFLIRIERDARVLANDIAEDRLRGDQSSPQESVDAYQKSTGARAIATDTEGVTIADSQEKIRQSFASRPEVATALEGSTTSGVRNSSTEGESLLFVALPINSGRQFFGVVRITLPSSQFEKQVRNYWLCLLFLGGLALMTAATFAYLLARQVVAPLDEIVNTSQSLANGDLTSRMSQKRRPKEFDRLAHAFNHMADRLEELINAQNAFVADASHQLRTPLTALRLRLESIDMIHSPDVVAAQIDAAVQEADRMSALVEGLLLLARQSSAPKTPLVQIVPDEIVRDRINQWLPLADERQIDFVFTGDRSVTAKALPGAVEQILDNLIDNAFGALETDTPDHTSHHNTITVTITAHDTTLEISVIDTGPGMSEEERCRALDRFWRSPTARPGGTGLGLPIAANLAQQSGGSLKLFPNEPTGLVATLTLQRENKLS